MARQLVVAAVLIALASPALAVFASGEAGERCTTHACPHHPLRPAATAMPCHHHAAAGSASCELKCDCHRTEPSRPMSSSPYLVTPAEALRIGFTSAAASPVSTATTRRGHPRLDAQPPRPRAL